MATSCGGCTGAPPPGAGELMVRREEQPWESHCTVLLDTRHDAHRGEGPASSFEWAVSAAASVALHVARAGYVVSLQGVDGAALTSPLDESGPQATLDALAIVQASSAGPIPPGTRLTAQDGLLVAVLGALTDAGRRDPAAGAPPGRFSRGGPAGRRHLARGRQPGPQPGCGDPAGRRLAGRGRPRRGRPDHALATGCSRFTDRSGRMKLTLLGLLATILTALGLHPDAGGLVVARGFRPLLGRGRGRLHAGAGRRHASPGRPAGRVPRPHPGGDPALLAGHRHPRRLPGAGRRAPVPAPDGQGVPLHQRQRPAGAQQGLAGGAGRGRRRTHRAAGRHLRRDVPRRGPRRTPPARPVRRPGRRASGTACRGSTSPSAPSAGWR